jgi:hypothetical protein
VFLALNCFSADIMIKFFTCLLIICCLYSAKNCALKKNVWCSSVLNFPCEFAVDGIHNDGFRWASEWMVDNQWLIIDLGVESLVNMVFIDWEVAYAVEYNISVSNDTVTWTDVYSTVDGKGGNESFSFSGVTTRYVRFDGITRINPTWGFSIHEFIVYCDYIYVSDRNSPEDSEACGSLLKPCRSVTYTYNHIVRNPTDEIHIYQILTEDEINFTDIILSGTTKSANFIGEGDNSVNGFVLYCMYIYLFSYDKTRARWIMQDNAKGSYVGINNIASFTDIHFVLPVSGMSNGFFFLGNGNSNCQLLINNCVFTSSQTGLKSIFIFNGSSDLQIIVNTTIFDGINSSAGFFLLFCL